MEQCEVAPMCCHCKEQHMAGNNECRKLLEETEISAVKQKKRFRYIAAKQRYFMSRQSGRNTFTDAAKRKVSIRRRR